MGSRTRVKVVKNKLAPPFQEAEFEIRWGTGIDASSDLIDYGLALGVLDKSGSFLSFGGQTLGQGREKARDALLAQADVAHAVRQAVELARSARGPVRERAQAEA